MKAIQNILIIFFTLTSLVFGRWDMNEFDQSYSVGSQNFYVNIDVDGGKVEVIKNDKATECHVSLKYPAENCEQDVNFDKAQNRLEITIDHEWLHGKDKSDDDNTEVLIELPGAPLITLNAEIKAGEINFELGDLKIQNFELRNWAGEVDIDFLQPNQTVMKNFDVNVKIGELDIRHLGNANFLNADIDGGIGELSVDFSGEKLRNARAFIDLDIGETTITVPEELDVKMNVKKFLFLSEVDYPNWFSREGRYYYSKNCRDDKEDLFLTVSSGIGEFKLQVR